MININLIPQYYLDQERKRTLLRLGTLIAGILLALFFASGGLLTIHSRSVEKNLRVVEGEISRYEEIAKQIDALKSKKSQIEAKIAVVEKLLADRFIYPKLLEFLTRTLSNALWFTSLGAQKNGNVLQIQIQASSLGLNGVIDWLARLEKEQKITAMNLGTITNNASAGESMSNFQISFQYQSQN